VVQGYLPQKALKRGKDSCGIFIFLGSAPIAAANTLEECRFLQRSFRVCRFWTAAILQAKHRKFKIEKSIMRQIVYFVGAGLSKSLELPEKPIPLMNDFISVLAEYLADDVIRLFLAKLEDMEPSPYQWHSPEAKVLAKTILANRLMASARDLDAFKRALKNRPYESIESLLEKVQSAGDREMVIRFGYAIDRFFDLLGWEVNWSPLEAFISRQLEPENSSHRFVSFNYDLLLDRAVEKLGHGEWDTSNGYGFSINYGIFDRFPSMVGQGVLPSVDAVYLNGSGSFTGRIQVLKPHGSLNWLVPLKVPYVTGSGGMQFEKDPVVVPITAEHKLRYVSSTETFKYVRFPEGDLSIDVSPCILPPVRSKFSDLPFLQEIREHELEAIKKANEIYVLGWSVPRTDHDQDCLIRTAISGRSKALSSVTVVNQGAPPEYFERIADLFGVERGYLKIFNAGFCDFCAIL
jgi:hypothetical protein